MIRFTLIPARDVAGGFRVLDNVARGVSDVYCCTDAINTAEWLNERDAGYPRLERFTGAKDDE